MTYRMPPVCVGVLVVFGLIAQVLFAAAAGAQVPGIGKEICVTCPEGGSSGGGNSGAREAGEAIGRAIREFLFGPDEDSGPSPAETARQERAEQSVALSNEGVAFFNQNRFKEALDKFRQAVALDPSNLISQANLAGTEAGFLWTDGNLEAALTKARQALTFNDHPTWRKLVSNIEQDFARAQAKKQADARNHAIAQQSVANIIASLQAQGSPDFDGRNADNGAPARLDFMTGSAPTVVSPTSPGAQSNQPHNDPSVVDLRDATTLTVDPNRLKSGGLNQQADQGLQFMTGLDRTRVPTPQEQARREADMQRRAAADRRYTEWQRKWIRQAENAAFQKQMHDMLLDKRRGYSADEERRAQMLYEYVIKPRAEAGLKEDIRKWKEMNAAMEVAERKWVGEDPQMAPALAAVQAELVRRGVMIADAQKKGLILPNESDFDLLFPKDPRTVWPGPKNPETPQPNPLREEQKWREFAAEQARVRELRNELLSLFENNPVADELLWQSVISEVAPAAADTTGRQRGAPPRPNMPENAPRIKN
jgi:tetratricopeptide (TPR) repeat protein